jgi:hypothetical protein
MGDYDAEKLKGAFKLICLKCGSEDVVIDIEDGIDYGGETGWSPGCISIGCNACEQNDIQIWR